MIKPHKTLGFLLLVLLILAGISFLFPQNEVMIGGIQLKYRNLKDIFNPEKVEYVDITAIVETHLEEDFSDTAFAIPLDTIQLMDTVKADAEMLAASEYPIINSEQGKTLLYKFFNEMENARSADKPVRIMHYGDSQIEADHITGFLRERLQQSFGGRGPGLLAVKPVTQKLSWRVNASDEWKRYTLFGKIDTTITHKRYGPMICLFRFAPPWSDSITQDSITENLIIDSLPTDTTVYTAKFNLKNSMQGYPATNDWDKARLFYGNLHSDCICRFKNAEDSLLKVDTLVAIDELTELSLGDDFDEINVEMEGKDSPDVYAISLESNNGIIVDNIPLRGSAGTVFTKMERAMMIKWLDKLNSKLLIVQFGVNVVTDKVDDFAYYERWIYHQLKAISEMRPDLAVIVVGVSDMSKKEGTDYVSFQAVSKIREAQKNAAMKAGYCFWDMLEAMGGENSMPSWVWADPPLANKDFTHFNVRGAKIISNMLYNALMLEYRNYKHSKPVAKTKKVQEEVNNEL